MAELATQYISISELAKKVGVSRDTVERWTHLCEDCLPTYRVIGKRGRQIKVEEFQVWYSQNSMRAN